MKIDGEIVHSASELKDYFNELGVSTNKSVQLHVKREDNSSQHIYIPLEN